jgi:hypothetical protein
MILYLYGKVAAARTKNSKEKFRHMADFFFAILCDMDWASKRKFIYGAGVILTILLVCTYLFRDALFPTPTCFDQKHNGFETGVDCGGACSLRCSQEVLPLSVSWTRAVPASSSTYDFIALVSNKNLDNAPRALAYTFIAYNANGLEIDRVSGTTTVPVNGDFPIIEQNVNLPSPPSEISAVIVSNIPHYKVVENPENPTLRVSNIRYEAGSIPRVYATVSNQKRLLLRNIPVRVVLYDAQGNAFAGGKTLIPELPKEQSRNIVFTWKTAFPFAPTQTRIFPILDPFLGTQ